MKETQETVLHLCAEYGQLKLFEYFQNKYGCNVMAKNFCGDTPFHHAAREGQKDILRLYLTKYYNENHSVDEFHIDIQNYDGWSAIHFATHNGFLTLVDYLVIDGGANINLIDGL